MERKKITVVSLEDRILKALVDDPNGADLEVLRTLSSLVIDGRAIDPDFQKVANAIVAQAVLIGSLPAQRKGRPKGIDSSIGLQATAMYFELVDSGVGYAAAVAKVAERFHKDERHIMRMVKSNKIYFGSTPAERNRKREWWKLCAEMNEGRQPLEFYTKILAESRERFEKRDLLQELDDQIDVVLARRFPAADTK